MVRSYFWKPIRRLGKIVFFCRLNVFVVVVVVFFIVRILSMSGPICC